MALSTYGDLQTDLADRMQRSDLTTRITSAVELATARFSRELRVPEMESTVSTTLVAEWTALPSDFLEIRAISVEDEVVEYVTPWQFQKLVQLTYVPSTKVYTIADMQFRVYPVPTSSDVDVLYYAQIPALVYSSDDNWLLLKYPDAYVNAAMVDLCKYVKDYDGMKVHEAYVTKFIDDMKRKSKTITLGSSPLSIKAA